MAKTTRSIIEDGLRGILSVFNNDPYFKFAQISFSKNLDHFVDRLLERRIDVVDVLKLMKKTVKNHKCEIVYVCCLEEMPLRVNIKNEDLVIGLTLHVDENGIKRLRLRTIFENFANRFDSRISTYVIMEQ